MAHSGDVDDWQRVGEAITARINELSLTKAEVIEASGVSDKTLAGYMAGQRIARADKRRNLCAALGWTRDSIDRILAGGEPEVLPSYDSMARDAILNDPLLDDEDRGHVLAVYDRFASTPRQSLR